jgi:hypothetical protein
MNWPHALHESHPYKGDTAFKGDGGTKKNAADPAFKAQDKR